MEITLTAGNFEAEVKKSSVPVLVDFWADWCMPCHAIAPAVAEIAKQYEGRAKVGKVNVDEHPKLAAAYHVSSIPTLKIFKNGQVVDDMIGALPKAEMVKLLEKHL